MKINIDVFKCLDAIASKSGLSDPKWAAASSVRRPTISELRRMAKHPNQKIGRACSIDKVCALYGGLYNIIGGVTLRKELLDCIAKELNQEVRLILYSLIIKDAPPETRDAVESTMKMAAQTTEKK